MSVTLSTAPSPKIDNTVLSKVVEISQEIKEHRVLEDAQFNSNKAVARYHLMYDGREFDFWLVLKQNLGKGTTLTSHGKVISRDSKMGGELLTQKGAKFRYTPIIGDEVDITMFNRAIYNPHCTGANAKNIKIKLFDNEGIELNLTSLHQGLDLSKLIESLEPETAASEFSDEEANAFLVQRDKAQFSRQQLKKLKQSFIIESAELRYQPILDSYQEDSKRSHLFDDYAVVIEGGPGTGKTTSLIQRIKYCLDPDVLEENKELLPKDYKEHILKITNKTQPSWVFFSPSHLLYMYLKESMSREGLSPSDETVKVWGEHKKLLLRYYGLLNPDTQRPFLLDRKNAGFSLFESSGEICQSLEKEFEEYILGLFNKDLIRLSAIDLSVFSWRHLAQKLFPQKERVGFDTLPELIRFLSSICNTYKNELREIKTPYTKLVNKIAAKQLISIKKLSTSHNAIYKYYHENISLIKDELIEVEDELIDDDGVNIDLADDIEFEEWLFSKLKSIVRKIALSKFEKESYLNKTEKELVKILSLDVSEDELHAIGELTFFKKHFDNWFSGVPRNIFNNIPKYYKSFRKGQLSSEHSIYDQDILNALVENGNVRLHHNEQAFLLGFINNMVKSYLRNVPKSAGRQGHSYIQAYHEYCKYVIAIDEATDFHPIDLYCMFSLRSVRMSSLSMCGDVMQRLTHDGLQSWDELSPIYDKVTVSTLVTSYRQSPTLLNIASKIYQHTTGQELAMQANIKENDEEPEALVYVEKDQNLKIKWLTNRILEIYKVYGKQIPSIAIFLNDGDQLQAFAKQLGSQEILEDVGINVDACLDGKILSNKNSIRVFDIKHIKGLEFEAAFFYDIDDLLKSNLGAELILRNLYVGLSRSAFYTGVTLNNPWPARLAFMKELFSEHSDWKI